MRPKGSEVCEFCGCNPRVLLDARVIQTKKYPKGHWMWMCVPCWKAFGLSKADADVTVYEKFFGRYHEIREGVKWLLRKL